MKKLPLVSILMPVYNSYDFVRSENQNLITKAIDSLLKQTYNNIELIILDNQSTDDTPAVCKRFAKSDPRIRYIEDSEKRYPEGGITQVASFANGKYCMVANDDDLWDIKYIEILVTYLESHPDIDLCYTNGNYIDIQGNIISKIDISKDQSYHDSTSPLSNLTHYILHRNPVPISFGLYKIKSFIDVLPYEDFDDLRANVDNHFFAKFFIKGKKINYIDKTLFNYRLKGRILEPDKIFGMPNLDRIDLIGFYYLRHQFYFYKKLVSTLSEEYKPTKNQADYLTSIFLCSLFHHFDNILKWLNITSKKDSQNNDNLTLLFREYSILIKKYRLDFPVIGDFSYDSFDNVRFEPTLNHNLLKINQIYLQNLSLLLDKQEIDDQIMIDLKNIVSSELSVHETRMGEIKSALTKTPDILTKIITTRTRTKGTPKVSIITTSYNLAKFVDETLRSVANQNCHEFEHIVIDGGSTDGSIELLKRYPNIVLVSEHDDGYQDALWKGLRLSKGEYIMQCCISDGYASTDWIKKCIEILDSNKDISLVWGFPQYLTEDSKPMTISYPQFHYNEAPQKYEMFNYWLKTKFYYPEGNLCVRKSVMLKCYPSAEDCKKGILDWLEFSYRFNSLGYVSMHLPTLANFGRTHGSQLSDQQQKSGTMKISAKNYLRKSFLYKMKLVTGLIKHNFINSKGEELGTKFDRKRFIMEDIVGSIFTINNKYLKPRKYLDFIKRKYLYTISKLQ